MSLWSNNDFHTRGSTDAVEVTEETVRWHAREASFMAGSWAALSKRIPRFVISEFKAQSDGPANPSLRTVVRLPVTVTEQPIPVGVVSNTYTLAQHADVVELCFQALRAHEIDTSTLRCEVGLTSLGEWMNFRVYLPEEFAYAASDAHKLKLRIECFNSVDGSSRLVILLGWFRLICTNGMIIGETKAALRDIHDDRLNLNVIPEIISQGLDKVKEDVARMRGWERVLLPALPFEAWVDEYLTSRWGKKAACRTFHICRTGADVEFADPFSPGKPSEKSIRMLGVVPGAANPATNLYDLCQALSWIATHRNNADERLEWQSHIPELIEHFRRASNAS
jgi:hypothetical protein